MTALIWLKRLLPLIVLAAGWFGYSSYTRYAAAARAAREDRYAQATAEIWVATVFYRNKPEQFIVFRDSLLAARGLDRSAVEKFLRTYDSAPEAMEPFVKQIKQHVDSLITYHYQRLDSLNADSL